VRLVAVALVRRGKRFEERSNVHDAMWREVNGIPQIPADMPAAMKEETLKVALGIVAVVEAPSTTYFLDC
jgi:hypothetical protein